MQSLAALRERIVDCGLRANLCIDAEYKLSALQEDKTYFTMEVFESSREKFSRFKKLLGKAFENKPSIIGEPPSFVRIDLEKEYAARMNSAASEGLCVDSDGKRYAYERKGVKYGGDFLTEPPQELYIEV